MMTTMMMMMVMLMIVEMSFVLWILAGDFNATTTSSDVNTTSSVATTDAAVNPSVTRKYAFPVVYGRHCALVGSDGWLSWYQSVRPAFGFVVYYVSPMLTIGVLYGRLVYTLMTSSPRLCNGASQEMLRRKQASRYSTGPLQIILQYTDL